MSRNHTNLYGIVMNKTCTPIILDESFDHALQVDTNGILFSWPFALFIALLKLVTDSNRFYYTFICELSRFHMLT